MMGTLAFKRLHDAARLPTRAHPTDAGMDLYPLQFFVIGPHKTEKVPTGLAVSIPEGYVGIIKGRSSLGAKGIDVHGGVIDSAFRGEILVELHNDSPGCEPIGELLPDGRRRPMAQMVVIPCSLATPTWVAELPASERGSGGFGSSDAKEE